MGIFNRLHLRERTSRFSLEAAPIFWISRTIGIRAGADYRRITAADSLVTQSRVHIGMVISGGS